MKNNNNNIRFNFDSISNTTLSTVPAATSELGGIKSIRRAVDRFILHADPKRIEDCAWAVLYLDRVENKRTKLGFSELGERVINHTLYRDLNSCVSKVEENLAYNAKCFKSFERGLALNFVVVGVDKQKDSSLSIRLIDVENFVDIKSSNT